MDVEVRGLNELIAKLDTAADDARPIIRRGLRAGAKVMRDAIAMRAPVRVPQQSGTALPPGALRADIVVHTDSEDGNVAIVIGPDKYTRHVAGWVEYGHDVVSGRRGDIVGHVPPHPFVRPAFEESAQAAEDAFAASVARSIERKLGGR